jgi:predicted phosphodiesterase
LLTQELIDICLLKRENKINLTWDQIASKYTDGKSGEYVRDKIKKYLKKQGKLPGKYENGKNKILVISDHHCPFNLPIEIYKDYVGKVDTLVFNGDEQDCLSLSKFIKKYRLPFVDEMIATRQMMIDIINYIKPKKVVVNFGNHSTRFLKYFGERIHEDLLQLMPETNLDFIIDIGFWHYNHENKTKTFYEPLVNVFKDKIEIIYTKNWHCRIGNTIFVHPSAYRNGILGTTEKAYLHFLQKGELIFDCLVVSHTHAQAISRYGKTFLIENGSCCKEMEYANSGKMQRPQAQGFAYIIQDKDGNFLYDESKLICI